MLFPRARDTLLGDKGYSSQGQGILFPGTSDKPPSEIRNNKSANIR